MTEDQDSRSKIMRSIRSISMLEQRVSMDLAQLGATFATNVHGMRGTPDIYKFSTNAVVFIDSCFWQGCPEHYREPKTNVEFWRKKLARNQEHDKLVTEEYTRRGYRIMRVWEHDLSKDKYMETLRKIKDFLENGQWLQSLL